MADPSKVMEAGPAKEAYDLLEREYYGNRTLTENAAGAFVTTGDHCLNLFATVVRSTSVSTLLQDFVGAWNEDPNKAVKLLYNLREIRGGKGEKKLPLTLMYALSCWKPMTYLANLQNFMELGYKDLLVISELAVRCAHIPNLKRFPQLGDGLELALMAAQLNQDE
ncbi:hypothetical protein RvY_05947 [Ramazzottius varieornatus]|uniref:DUF2828 domain-containing protein n=1 Tax=Ramazzottius varieornatus TaxID=947166 RepID=A0A1D1V6I3_RAMVA|nr:hypothetical protein RvY_05947 [Ramazzottius varieornatus]